MTDLTSDDISLIVAENLAKIREFQGLNQVEMAEKIQTFQVAYCLSEQGNRELNFVNLYSIAVEFGINLNFLFGLSDVRMDPGSRIKHTENISKINVRRKRFTKKKR